MTIGSLFRTPLMNGPKTKKNMSKSASQNFHRFDLGRRTDTKHPTRADILAMEFLSNGGIIWNLITAPAGRSSWAPKIVKSVAEPGCLVENKTITTIGQTTSIMKAKVFGINWRF